MIQFKEAISGQHYFVLKANNNEIVGTSQMYDTQQARQKGADAVLKCCGEYWALAIATLLEERNEGHLTIEDAVKMLMSLKNTDLQEIIDRIPYDSK